MKAVIVSSLAFLSLAPALAFAAPLARIAEIMYDPPGADEGHEWIEIENVGTSTIDLSDWRLLESGSRHKLSRADGSAPVLDPGERVVVSPNPDRFAADNPGLKAWKSAFSLANTGETVALIDESGATEDLVAYRSSWGAAGDGNSLQLSPEGSWISAPPTPVAANARFAAAPASSDARSRGASDVTARAGGSGVSESASSAPNASSIEAISAHMRPETAYSKSISSGLDVSIGRERLGFSGSFFPFEAETSGGALGDVRSSGSRVQTIWSFGDGSRATGEAVSHAYESAGDYIVVANSSYEDGAGRIERAVARTTVHAIAPNLVVSIGPEGGIGIENKSPYEANVGGFSLIADGAQFAIPDDTIIAPRSRSDIPRDVSNLEPKGAVLLRDALGRAIAVSGSPPESDIVVSLPPEWSAAAFSLRFREFIGLNGK